MSEEAEAEVVDAPEASEGGDRVAEAVAMFERFDSVIPPEESEAATAGETDQKSNDLAAGEATAEVDADPLESLVGALKERQASRTTPADPTAELRAEIEALKAAAKPAASVPDGYVKLEDITAAVQRDPMAWLQQVGVDPKAHAKSVYKGILDPAASTVEAKLTAQLEELKAEIAGLRGEAPAPDPAVQQLVQQHRQQQVRDVEQHFISLVQGEDGESAYPLVAKAAASKDLGSRYVIERAYRISSECKDRGAPMPENEEILATLQKQLEREQRALSPAVTGNQKRSRQGTSAITSDLASAGTPRTAETMEERVQLAIQKLKDFDAAS